MIRGKIDLHTHTTYSDGSYTPAQLIYKVRQAGISIFSITDHDTVAALPEAETLSIFYDLTLISGVEFTTYVDEREVHILGYFFDRANRDLLEILQLCAHDRLRRAEGILEHLQRLQMPITMEEVLKEAGTAPVTRPHIAMVMVKKGYSRSFYDAFEQYLGNAGPCYVQKFALSPEVVFEIVKNAGGISVLAHPVNLPEAIIAKVIKSGVDGIEAFHPSHSNADTRAFSELARSKSLFISGGSDFHGGKKNDESNLGKYQTPEASYQSMLIHTRKARAV